MANELATIMVVAKAHCFYISMIVNISYNRSSFEDEKLKLFESEVLELSPIELKPWFENQAMISK
jgi:hypothetical protein